MVDRGVRLWKTDNVHVEFTPISKSPSDLDVVWLWLWDGLFDFVHIYMYPTYSASILLVLGAKSRQLESDSKTS